MIVVQLILFMFGFWMINKGVSDYSEETPNLPILYILLGIITITTLAVFG